MFLKTDGLVVRQVNYKDNDQILTVLTKEHGLMTLKARGVRSRSSRLKGACQLLAYSEFTVFENRGFHTIDEANAIQMFPELRTDIELLSLASYFTQVAEVLSQEDMPNPELLSLTLNAFYALCRRLCMPELVKAADKLSAYIKCVEELKAGNSEFRDAAAQTRAALEEYELPEVTYFLETFMPSFSLTLDQLK